MDKSARIQRKEGEWAVKTLAAILAKMITFLLQLQCSE